MKVTKKKKELNRVIIQRAVAEKSLPTTAKLKHWASAALKNKIEAAELTIRIVSKDEITELNSTYRKKNKPTNVLSFPFEMPEECDELPILGDIILCAAVIREEAMEQDCNATVPNASYYGDV